LRGDCIVAVNATKGAADLSDEFKELTRKEGTRIVMILDVEGLREAIKGFGSSSLTFTHPSDLVARKSIFTCSRTLMIGSDRAARDFSKDFVKLLKNSSQKITVTLVAED
jgi:hypothetical protein